MEKITAKSLPAGSPDNSSTRSGDHASQGDAAPSAWKRPANGTIHTGPSVDAFSWPALSESTKSSPKSLSDPSKSPHSAAVSSSQEPVVIQRSPPPPPPPSPPSIQASAAPKMNCKQGCAIPAGQRTVRRGGYSGGTSFTHVRPPPPPPPPPQTAVAATQFLPPPPPQFSAYGVLPSGYGRAVPVHPDLPPTEPVYRGNNKETRGTRRVGGGFVPYGRMDSFPQKDHEYGNYIWTSHHRPIGSEAHALPPYRVPPRGGYVRPPQLNFTPYYYHERAYGGPVGFSDVSAPLYITQALPPELIGGYFNPHLPPPPPPLAPPPMTLPPPEPSLPKLLINQIDYYFSDANLVGDEFLKSNMDDHGWVPVSLISTFPRVQALTDNIRLILDSLRGSTLVEVKENQMRRRDDWMKWLPPLPVSALASSLQKAVTLDSDDDDDAAAGTATPPSGGGPNGRG